MSNVRDIDRGWKQYVKDMGRIQGSFVKVGLPEGFVPGEPSRVPKEGGVEIREESEILVIGLTHEFGTTEAGPNNNITIPERSYLRTSFDENKSKNSQRIEKVYGMILSRRKSVREGLATIGASVTAQVKKKIRDLRTPPLKPSTIARKGSSNPLIDTGQLVNSINYEVSVNNG